MLAVKLSDIMSGLIVFENILPIRVLDWLAIVVGCKIKGINELDASKSKNSFVRLCSLQFNRLTLKSLSRKIDFCSLKIFSNSLLSNGF